MTAQAKDQFAELCSAFPLRPIRNQSQFAAAETLAHRILRKSNPTEDEEDYLESLSALMHEYEAVHHPDDADDVSGAQMLRFMMETNNVTETELSTATGIPLASLSAMIRARRSITAKHAHMLGTYFHLEPTVFLPRSKKGQAV